MRIHFIYMLIVFLVLFCTNVFAAAPPPDPPNIPLDPFSWVLLATGGVVAGKKYYDYRKSKNTDETKV